MCAVDKEMKISSIELCVSTLEIIKESIISGDNKELCEMIQSDLSAEEHRQGVIKLCSDVLNQSISYLKEFKEVLLE